MEVQLDCKNVWGLTVLKEKATEPSEARTFFRIIAADTSDDGETDAQKVIRDDYYAAWARSAPGSHVRFEAVHIIAKRHFR